RGLVLRIEARLRRPVRDDERPLGRFVEIDEEAVLAGRYFLRTEGERRFGLEPRGDVRAGAPYRRRRESRRADIVGRLAVVGAGAEEIASALQRTPERDLDPLAVLISFAAKREGRPLTLDPLAEHLGLRRAVGAHRPRAA